MLLIEQKPYNKITVSDITRKAGIARQTFYRNYHKKSDIIEQYLSKSINVELFMPEKSEGDEKKATLVLTYDLEYIISHKNDLMKIALKINTENLFASRFREWVDDLIDRYRDNLSAEEYVVYRYRVYQRIVGKAYILADWLKHDMPLSVEKLRSFLNSFTFPDSLQYKHIPHIIIREKKE
jgi:AcrR family transcriptional regulator